MCLFMQSDFSESNLINIVDKSTLCSPLTFSAFKNGVSVPLGRILSPNNGVAVRKVASSVQHIVEQSEIDKTQNEEAEISFEATSINLR